MLERLDNLLREIRSEVLTPGPGELQTVLVFVVTQHVIDN